MADKRKNNQIPDEVHHYNASITPAECSSMQLLYNDGYTISELSMMFNLGQTGVSNHANANCTYHDKTGK